MHDSQKMLALETDCIPHLKVPLDTSAAATTFICSGEGKLERIMLKSRRHCVWRCTAKLPSLLLIEDGALLLLSQGKQHHPRPRRVQPPNKLDNVQPPKDFITHTPTRAKRDKPGVSLVLREDSLADTSSCVALYTLLHAHLYCNPFPLLFLLPFLLLSIYFPNAWYV